MPSAVTELIEQAISRESREKKLSRLRVTRPWHPDITISRDPGSGGRVIAEKVAKKLGWQLLDRRLMFTLANELGIPEKEFANVDEHNRPWLADTIQSIFNPDFVSDVRYINNLKKILLHAASHNDIVVVGRGANYIIPPERCLRVRVTASFKTRVDNTFKYEHKKSREEAAEWVRHVEARRSNFIMQYFGRDSYAPEHYDLIVNTDYLTLETARDLVIDAYLAKFPDERRHLKNKL